MSSKLLPLLKRHALRIIVSMSILLYFILYANHWLPSDLALSTFITALENKIYDVRLRSTLPKIKDDPRIVIIDIDEKSLKEIGRWPWNRAVMAKLLDQLFDTYKIDVLGLDVVFAEADDSSGLKRLDELAAGPLQQQPSFLDTLNQLRPQLDYDHLFAHSMQHHKVVLGHIFLNQHGEATQTCQATKLNPSVATQAGQLPPPIFSAAVAATYDLKQVFVGEGFTANLPLFQASATTTGHFNSEPDADGITRKVPLLYCYQGALYESLALAVTRLALGVEKIEIDSRITATGNAIVNLLLTDKIIPIDSKLSAWIPYRGPNHTFSYISATDVLHQRISDPTLLTNKIVLLGTSAQGLVDLRTTPLERTFPGVEIHANIVSGILSGTFKSHLFNENQVEIWLFFGIGIIMITLLPLFSPLIATFGTLLLSILVIILNMLFWNAQIVFPLAATLLLILFLFIFNMSYGYFVETRNKHHLSHLFGQYIPPELVNEMNKRLGETVFTTEAENREMTVLFSDVRGFTTISEGLEPKELSDLMNQYLTPMTRIIHDYRGTIDKYMGDAIMAFWGAPLPDSQHANKAVAAATQMLKSLKEMQPQFKANGWPEIKIGIGLNTGTMSVGNMGSEFRMAYTVLGDAVNLGSRLEGITKQYGVSFIVSETTKAAAPAYLYRELDRVRVKGKDLPVGIFEPIGLREQVSRSEFEELVEYESALDHYRCQHWKEASSLFSALHQQHPARPLYKIYLERIQYFMEHSPGDTWDGVYTFTTK